jgi:biotin/methionine sulfoxide reductase
MNPRDAKVRGIADGDIIRLFNTRGAFLAAVRVTEDIAPGLGQTPIPQSRV